MTRVVVIVCFIMAFAAGLLVGWQTRTRVAAGPDVASPASTRPSRGPTGWLVRELSLNDAQREQLEKIWSDMARHGGREREEQRRQLRRERDEAIAALVRPEDYGKYDQILKHYFDRSDAIDLEMRAAFDAAVEKTKSILTDAQRAKYEELLRRHRPPDRDGRDARDGRDRDARDGGHRGDKDRDPRDRGDDDKHDKDKHGAREPAGREPFSRWGDDPRVTPRPSTAPTAGVTSL